MYWVFLFWRLVSAVLCPPRNLSQCDIEADVQAVPNVQMEWYRLFLPQMKMILLKLHQSTYRLQNPEVDLHYLFAVTNQIWRASCALVYQPCMEQAAIDEMCAEVNELMNMQCNDFKYLHEWERHLENFISYVVTSIIPGFKPSSALFIDIFEQIQLFTAQFSGDPKNVAFFYYPSRLCNQLDVRPAVTRPFVDGTNFFQDSVSSEELVSEFPDGWILNIGGGDGECRRGQSYDPANCLFSANWPGVLIEADPELARAAMQKHRHVRVAPLAVTPESIPAVLQMGKKLGRLRMVKIDIDHADCALLERLIQEAEVDVVHIEFNPLFPPPFDFRQTWDSARMENDHHHLIGCSLQAMVNISGFAVHHVEFENVVLIHSRHVLKQESPMRQYMNGYCHPLARVLEWREINARYDFSQWVEETPLEHRATLIHKFIAERQQHGFNYTMHF